MAKTQFLEYYIHLTNKANVDALQAQYPNGLLGVAPATAAITYSAPIQEYEAAFIAPCLRSPWFWFGPVKYPRNVAEFSRTTGGIFGIGFLFGTTTTFKWFGRFVYSAPAVQEVNGVPVPPASRDPIAQRKWTIGFEAPTDGEHPASLGAIAQRTSRDASRHADGYGLACRQAAIFATGVQTLFGASEPRQWERFYFRIRSAPATATDIWHTRGSVNTLNGALLQISSTLQLILATTDPIAILTTYTTPLVIDKWYKLDAFYEYAAFPAANCKIFLNGVLIFNVTSWPTGTGLSQNANAANSRLGNSSLAATTLEIDYDDWECMSWPANPPQFTGLDFLNGTKIQNVNGRSFGADHDASWVGDFRKTEQIPGLGETQSLTSSTSGAILDLAIDYDRKVDAQLGVLGVAAFTVHAATNLASGVINGQLGYKIDVAAPVLVALTSETSADAYRAMMYRPSGMATPVDVTPLRLRYVKGVSAIACTVRNLHASVALIGVFGDEDVKPETVGDPLAYPGRHGLHMAPYPETPWARKGAAPISPVITHSGTYAGNNTFNDLQFRCPVTWLWIRRVANANAEGVQWWTSMLAPKVGMQNGPRGDHIAEVLIDPALNGSGSVTQDLQEQRTLVRVHGNAAVSNATGSTYQYLAFEDPGGRFSLNGKFSHANTLAVAVNTLVNTKFLAQAAFFIPEILTSVIASVFRMSYRGVGYTGTNHSVLNAAETASGAEFALGTITSYANLHAPDGATSPGTPFAAFRMDDGSADVNKHKVIKIGTYVGTGAGSLVVTLAGLPSGLRPLWAIVVPHNATAVMRDPSHTGTTSTQLSNGTEVPANGISAGGIDQMTVGTQLNAAQTYDYLVFMGSATAGNNGWSINGEFSVVEPDSPFDGDWAPDPPVPTPSTPGVAGPADCSITTDAGACAAALTRVGNVALSRLGVTLTLGNACTDASREAIAMRVVLDHEIRTVLRARPWPFATKYLALSLASTQPTDDDWSFAYIQPSDCIFERRLVVARSGAVNPTPPPFMLSSNSTGGLIFTNQAAAVLEYTFRPECVALYSDDLFKDALAWKLAAALAAPLSRMTDVRDSCLKHYQECLDQYDAVIKPGVPGETLTIPNALDTPGGGLDVSCAAANVAVVNRALIRIGAQTIANLTTEQSREAIAASLIFENELRTVLRDHAWAFATAYQDPLTLVGGTSAVPVNKDWQYSYRVPSTCVLARRLVHGDKRQYDTDPAQFRLGHDATGALLFTDEPPVTTGANTSPVLEYTTRVTCAVLYGDALFNDALAWRLAAALAPSLAQVMPEDPEQRGRGPHNPQEGQRREAVKPNLAAMRRAVQRDALVMYTRVLMQAQAADMNEQQPAKPGDADWILGRE